MKLNATILVTFFNSHELTNIVLESSTKLSGAKLDHLAQGLNYKSCSFFQRNIQNRTRLKGIQFLKFCNRMGV